MKSCILLNMKFNTHRQSTVRALGGHLLRPSLLAGSATSLWFLTDVYLNTCSQHLLKIYSALGAENYSSFLQTIPFLQSQIQAENPALSCVLQQFYSPFSCVLIQGKERKNLPTSPPFIAQRDCLSCLCLEATFTFVYFSIFCFKTSWHFCMPGTFWTVCPLLCSFFI